MEVDEYQSRRIAEDAAMVDDSQSLNGRIKREEQDEEVTSSAMQQFQQEAAVLQSLPLPLQLIALATRYLAAAHSLSPLIAERPKDEVQAGPAVKLEDGDQDAGHMHESDDARGHADYISAYRRYISASMTCCRAVVDGGKDSTRTQDFDVRYELRARAMLAELLVRETKDVAEAELHITKGLTAASKHPSFTEYRYRFLHLQIELALSAGNSKFAKLTVRKCIKELSELDQGFVPWLYRFHFLHVQISQEFEQDYRATMTALVEVANLARSQNDRILEWILQVLMGRVALLENDAALARKILVDLAGGFSLPMTEQAMNDEQKSRLAQMDPEVEREERSNYLLHVKHKDPMMEANLPRAVVAYFLVLLSVYQAHIGEGPVAKQTVKRAHTVLDEPDLQPGQVEGWMRIAICSQPSKPGSPNKPIFNDPYIGREPSYLYLSIAPKSLFYAYTFLVSTVIQIDPSGKLPRCLAYATYGLDNLNVKVRGVEAAVFKSPIGLNDIGPSIRKIAEMQSELMLYQVELYIMRSSFHAANIVIADLITFLNTHDLWQSFCARVCLAQGMIYHSLGALDAAFDSYAVACKHAAPRSHLFAVCRASILVIRLAQGYDIRISKEAKKSKSSAPSSLLPTIKLENGDEVLVEDYENYVKNLLDDCQKGGPMLKLMGLLLDALTNAEIVRAKACLKAALQTSNQINNQHVKPLILALLASYFNHTENDQAQKMLHSAHVICRSMSGHHEERNKSGDKKEKIIGPESVGMLLLGLWTGEELSRSYEQTKMPEKAKKQELYNKAHRDAIALELHENGLETRSAM